MKEEEAAMPGDGRRAIVGARHGRRAACRLDRRVLSPHRALEGLTIGHLRMGGLHRVSALAQARPHARQAAGGRRPEQARGRAVL